MRNVDRLQIAVQKKGRLHTDSMDLWMQCGIKIRMSKNSLFCHSENLAVDFLFVRDDDIPTLVQSGVSDVGIVGQNVLQEYCLQRQHQTSDLGLSQLRDLGFGQCRLSLAVAETDKDKLTQASALQDKKIATSYPAILKDYLSRQGISAKIIPLSGSVEIAPRLGIADAICDLVSSGLTLEENGLQEMATIMHSQAVLIKTKRELSSKKLATLDLIERRIKGVLQAQESKYVMFHAPREAMETITRLLPGSESPTVLPLVGNDQKVVVHLVTGEAVFWDTLERLKLAGASAILVLPIEKMLA